MKPSSEMIFIVRTKWNESLTVPLAQGAMQTIQDAKISCREIIVPGALEIPLAIQWLKSKYEDLLGCIACGVVIQGETLHFDIVSRESARGIAELSLKLDIPIGNAILPVYTMEQAMDRIGGKIGHKGAEAASAVLEMIRLRKEL